MLDKYAAVSRFAVGLRASATSSATALPESLRFEEPVALRKWPLAACAFEPLHYESTATCQVALQEHRRLFAPCAGR